MIKFIEQGPLSAAIAEEFFGWKWMSWVDCPTRNHPDYPTECRVRQFMSPDSLKDERWKAFWADKELAEAVGDEPLSYAYCSSMGPACYPSFATNRDDCYSLEKEIDRRGLWNEYHAALSVLCRNSPKRIHFASPKTRCIAALTAIGSKRVEVKTIDKAPTLGENFEE